MMIGDVSKATGIIVETIRFYERSGLIPSARRMDNGRRVYDENDVRRLKLVRQCRELGFNTEDVATFLALLKAPQASCREASAISLVHVDAIDRKIKRLQTLKKRLQKVAVSCTGKTVATCKILQMLE